MQIYNKNFQKVLKDRKIVNKILKIDQNNVNLIIDIQGAAINQLLYLR
jgi:hypothetical protein